MKNLVLLFVIPLLAGCDFSQFFKKEITAIVCVDQVNVLPNEEIAFDLSVLPEKMTIPEWKIEYDNTSLEFTTVEIPGVTPKYERTVKALKTGKYPLKITETTSRLSKTVIVNCADMIDDFILPATKILALNTSFRIADYVTFIPAENIIYDFEYEFDSPLLTYNPQNGYFKTGNQTGEAEIMVKETKTALSKPIKIVISDQYLTFEPVTVEMLKETPLPDEIINHIVKNNLKIVYPENDGLIINTDKYTVLATAAKTWTVEFYLTIDGEYSLFGYSEITARPLENPVFDIEVPMITETPIPDEIKTYIISNNLELVYTENDGLFIDTVKYTILTTKAQTRIVELYKTFDGQTFLFGRLQITSEPIQSTPFEQITLEAGLKQSMPEELVQFIKENGLEADYELGSGLSIELKDYSLTASDAGEWTVELFKTVRDKKFTLATVPVVCAEWFFADFYYAQRVLEKRQYTLVNEEAILDRFHEMNNLTVKYSWSGTAGKPLTYDEAGRLKDIGFSISGRGSAGATQKCIDDKVYSRLFPQQKDSITKNYTKESYNTFSKDKEFQNEFAYYEYDTKLYIDNQHRHLFFELGDCHTGSGLMPYPASTNYNHWAYLYPKTEKSAYPTLKTTLDNYFSDQITKIKEKFKDTASSEIFSIDGLAVKTTDGSFSIKENQDDKIYDNVGSGGSIEKENVSVEQLDTKNGSFTKIAFDAANVMIEKTLSMVKEPKYPIVRKIVLSWTSEQMVFKGFTQVVNDDYHNISISDDQNNQTLTINITEKDLSSDNAILNGVIGHALFEDANGKQIQKLIEIIKE